MKLVILGAHTAVGRALAETLEDRALDTEVVKATTLDQLEGDLDLIDENTLNNAAIVFLASDDSFTRKVAQAASRVAAPVVDLTGGGHEGASLLFPFVGSGVQLQASKLFRVPVGFVYGVVAILRALEALGPVRARVVTLEGAAGAGQPGIDELSEQTRSVFSQKPKESEVFYAPTAFNILSSVGAEDDPFEPDLRFAEDVRGGLRDLEFDIDVVRTRVPVFSAEGASLEVECREPAEREQVVSALEAVRGLRYSKTLGLSTLEAADRDDLLVGRLRTRGRRIDLWLAADRLRHGAAWPAAVLAEMWLQTGDTR